MHKPRGRLTAFAAFAVTATLALGAPATGATGARDEPHRPQIHFSPAMNWMNDPNGLVWYDGEYHLFFQYNPEGDQWGNMSWGHAVSTDLVHWEELPVAIPFSESEHIFSGSIVVDENNTSGFGSDDEPAMVAVYTSFNPQTGIQAQSLAYSTDRGRTWINYAGNPVLDIGSREFRDPKVFWDDDAGYWVMALVLATERKVRFYRSDDLKTWSHLSDFGPANAVGGVWEVPDLFELPVDGDPRNTKWVLVVNMNPGSVAGGSGAQYFVGDWDGTRFTAENAASGPPEPPAGTVFEDFEGGYASWTVENDPELSPGPFGSAPYPGTVPGQQQVSGHLGASLVNSFLGFDAPRGRMVSDEFTVTENFVNLLVGGGDHPHVPGTTTEYAPADAEVIADFELPDGQTFEAAGWSATGDLRNQSPHVGPAARERGHVGQKLLTTFVDADRATGTLTSPAFTVERDHLSLLVGGGGHRRGSTSGATVVELLVDGDVVRTGTGSFSGFMNWVSWDVSAFAGREAQLRVVDENTGGWGHLLVDHVVATDQPVRPRSVETAVNLVVDGEVARSATGRDAERLDWVAWDVRDLVGRRARLEINDFNSGGWGHLNVDHIVFSEHPAASELEQYSWLDYGKDFYAAISYEGVPGDRRIVAGWMNNWQYAGGVPTAPWRGALALPREVELRTIDGELRLVQRPVRQLRSLRAEDAFTMRDTRIPEGETTLPDAADGTVLEIVADFEVRSAERFGLRVRGGREEWTTIGYDVETKRLFVDRTASGADGFSPRFAGVQSGPLTVTGGRVRMTVYVDRSSVEVFGGRARQ